MKIGIRKAKTDLSIKHISFEVDGELHTICFRFSHRRGITGWKKPDYVIFDSKEAKIIDAYPPLLKVIGLSVTIVRYDLCRLMRHFQERYPDFSLWVSIVALAASIIVPILREFLEKMI